jgi:hypothetical protein
MENDRERAKEAPQFFFLQCWSAPCRHSNIIKIFDIKKFFINFLQKKQIF